MKKGSSIPSSIKVNTLKTSLFLCNIQNDIPHFETSGLEDARKIIDVISKGNHLFFVRLANPA
jgi:hypothetical protein